jgi:hypothetical protein
MLDYSPRQRVHWCFMTACLMQSHWSLLPCFPPPPSICNVDMHSLDISLMKIIFMFTSVLFWSKVWSTKSHKHIPVITIRDITVARFPNTEVHVLLRAWCIDPQLGEVWIQSANHSCCVALYQDTVKYMKFNRIPAVVYHIWCRQLYGLFPLSYVKIKKK